MGGKEEGFTGEANLRLNMERRGTGEARGDRALKTGQRRLNGAIHL